MQLTRAIPLSLCLLGAALFAPASASALVCERHSDCDDGNVCSSDLCVDGSCVHSPLDTPCEDNDICTVDMCDPTDGCSNAPMACDDGNACTTDGCDPATGCDNDPIEMNCDDGNPCTADACDPATGSCGSVSDDDATCESDVMCGKASCQDGECVVDAPSPEDLGHKCGDVPAVGACYGHNFKRCVDGEVETTNCIAKNRVCGWDDDGWDGWGAFGCVSQDSPHPACAGIPDSGKCIGSTLYWCDTDTGETHVHKCSADAMCGWGGSFFCCQDVRDCVPLCQGKQCGDDGCGGRCGECDGICTDGGECLDCTEPPVEDDPTDNRPEDVDGETDNGDGDKDTEKKPISCTTTGGPGSGPGTLMLLLLGLTAMVIRRRLV